MPDTHSTPDNAKVFQSGVNPDGQKFKYHLKGIGGRKKKIEKIRIDLSKGMVGLMKK